MKHISRQEAKVAGLNKFYTGRPCKYGHIAERHTSSSNCVVCRLRMNKEWANRHPVQAAAIRLAYRNELKQACFDFLGRKCVCCGETEPTFLCIDHIGGGGNKHRIVVRGTQFLLWLISEASGVGKAAIRKKFRILCCNCNSAFHFLGYCPHHPRRK